MSSRDPAHVVTESLRFLEIIVRDNAIGYPQERPNSAWTAGYYVNNAYFRLQFAQTKLLKCKKGEPFSDALATLTCNCEDENSYPDMQLRWDLCFEAAAEALKLFRHSYEPETANAQPVITAMSLAEAVAYIRERIVKLKPKKKDGVARSIAAMFRSTGGIASAQIEETILQLQKERFLDIDESGHVTYKKG